MVTVAGVVTRSNERVVVTGVIMIASRGARGRIWEVARRVWGGAMHRPGGGVRRVTVNYNELSLGCSMHPEYPVGTYLVLGQGIPYPATLIHRHHGYPRFAVAGLDSMSALRPDSDWREERPECLVMVITRHKSGKYYGQ